VTLATKPTFCYDGITANDMYSDIPCAVTGSLVIVGGFSAVMWGMRNRPATALLR
jgi:hypothetical protein